MSAPLPCNFPRPLLRVVPSPETKRPLEGCRSPLYGEQSVKKNRTHFLIPTSFVVPQHGRVANRARTLATGASSVRGGAPRERENSRSDCFAKHRDRWTHAGSVPRRELTLEQLEKVFERSILQ